MLSNDQKKQDSGSNLMRFGMMACCAVMLLPVAAFLLAGGTIAGMLSNLGLFAPIALCIGAHVLMFKMMGKSCHSSSEEPELRTVEDPKYADSNTSVPKVARQA